MPRNYSKGTLVYVSVPGYSDLKYGFSSRIDQNLRSDFGQTVISAGTASQLTNFVLGANSPKPFRASKFFNNTRGYQASYCGVSQVVNLRKAGYQVTRGRRRYGKNTALSVTRYVTLNGIKYAWQSPKAVSGKPIDYSLLGVKEAASGADDLIFGATFPKPARATTTDEDGSKLSSYCDPTQEAALRAENWTVVKANYDEDNFKRYIS